ncbi:hypothetical protein IV203_028389 [Nitzschia inconspicua]|uniref:Uncharacterized protein n=1 Tax=Nitzschia inconspicua TaxID=303405 RepID=A0A9K3LND3_9STRA|nr:hypothetical protein IV203_028389 [Nitzschia inconspicua]
MPCWMSLREDKATLSDGEDDLITYLQLLPTVHVKRKFCNDQKGLTVNRNNKGTVSGAPKMAVKIPFGPTDWIVCHFRFVSVVSVTGKQTALLIVR